MEKEAEILNSVLEGTVVNDLLSDIGRSLFFPKGIVYQTEQAKLHANFLNATVGMAKENGKPIHLRLIDEMIGDISPDEIYSYAPSAGVEELRELWLEQLLLKNPRLKNGITSKPMVTGGVTNGLSIIADLFTDNGDALLLPELYWGNYKLIFSIKNGCSILTYNTFNDKGEYNIDGLDELIKKYNKDKLMILFNFPHNPTGYSPYSHEINGFKEIILKHADSGKKILLIFDDSYFGFFYEDDVYKHSLFNEFFDIHENVLSIKLDGATKEDFAWGFRIAFITYGGKGLKKEHYEALELKTKGMIRATISSANRLAQTLLIQAYENNNYSEEKREKFELLRSRFNEVKRQLEGRNSKYLTPLPFNSGYFLCFEVRGSAERLREYLLMKKGIGMISITDRYLRVSYASVDLENIKVLIDEIYRACEELFS